MMLDGGVSLSCRCCRDDKFTQYTEDKQAKLTFEHLVLHTRLWAVGPLEYCGSAIPLLPKKGEGKLNTQVCVQLRS